MRLFPVAVAILGACYHTTEWGSTGDYRAHPSHTGEQQVETQQVARFDEKDAIRAIVESKGKCRPTIEGDHIEERQESTTRLSGTGWLVASSLLVGAGGAFGILFAAADANNMDVYGNQLPPHYSDSVHNTLYVAGGITLAVAIAGIIAAVELPEEKRHDRWTPVEGNPHQVVTSDELVPCTAPATPVEGVAVHVAVRFEKGTGLEYDIKTDAAGSAIIDMLPVRIVAGWCGEGVVTATVLDQTWHGTTGGEKIPLDQIPNEKLRALAASCAPP